MSDSPANGGSYDGIVRRDRTALLLGQFKLRDNGVPIVIVVSGMHASGSPEVVNLLNEWMDTRYIENAVYRPPTEEEAERPYFWRFWKLLPKPGMITLFLGSWYTEPYQQALNGTITNGQLQARLREIKAFEQLLVESGTLLIKIRLILSRKEQSNRMMEMVPKPGFSWQLGMDDPNPYYSFKKKRKLSNDIVSETSTEIAPWHTMDANDEKARNLSVLHLLINRFQASGETLVKSNRGPAPRQPDTGELTAPIQTNPKPLGRKAYNNRFNRLKESIYISAWEIFKKQKSLVIVFEGSDAAGKGGAIRRLISCLDARLYRVIQIGAPTAEEKAKPYLWRFWMQVPRAGFITIYDRSWYGRVLVERVEGFAQEHEWKRAYSEINEFEKELVDHGMILLKFWLEITPEEQLKRFKEREKTAYKQYKLTDEDWRNREKRHLYDEAVGDMLDFTSTATAPWHVVDSNNKLRSRISVLEAVDKALKKVVQKG